MHGTVSSGLRSHRTVPFSGRGTASARTRTSTFLPSAGMGNVRHYLLIKVADSISSPSGLIAFSSFPPNLHNTPTKFKLVFHLHPDTSTTFIPTTILRPPTKSLATALPASSPSPYFNWNLSFWECHLPLRRLICFAVAYSGSRTASAIVATVLPRPRSLAFPPERSNETQDVPSRLRSLLTPPRSPWPLGLLPGP
jgi:hypothetical protein